MALTLKDYEDAMMAQGACNLSGIVFSFSRIMERLCEEVQDTDARNKHPIARLFAEQIGYLSGMGMGNSDTYSKAYTTVLQKIEELKGGENDTQNHCG